MLRLDLNWFCGGPELPGQLGAVVNACAAVATGLAKHVLCFRTVWESTAQGGGRRQGIGAGGRDRFRASGMMQWTLPYGAASAAVWIAMMANRHFHEYGTTREQLGAIPINARRNAGLNPKAIYRDPMTMDDYLSSRMISEPFCLYDCDVPVDGCTAVIVSRADVAKDLRRTPLVVEAVGTAIHGRPSWDQWDDLTTMSLRDAGAMLWRRTDLTPADVDCAQLYDGFSFITLAWLEALGFCGKGASGPFIEGGPRLALDGEIPLNTHGGQLSEAYIHGMNGVNEGVRLIRGTSSNQPEKNDHVLVTAGIGVPTSGMILGKLD